MHDLNGDGGATDADDRAGSLETNRVGRELRDLAGDVHRHATNEVQDETQPTLGWREQKAVETDFAARAERDARVVDERDAKTPIAAGAETVGLVDLLANLGWFAGAAADDEDLSRERA